MNFILGFYMLFRLLYQDYWKNHPSQQLLKVIILYFAATCFGPCWPSSGGIHNYIFNAVCLKCIYTQSIHTYRCI
jgi:hypothetical protein